MRIEWVGVGGDGWLRDPVEERRVVRTHLAFGGCGNRDPVWTSSQLGICLNSALEGGRVVDREQGSTTFPSSPFSNQQLGSCTSWPFWIVLLVQKYWVWHNEISKYYLGQVKNYSKLRNRQKRLLSVLSVQAWLSIYWTILFHYKAKAHLENFVQ